jgi:hypothetical protein
MANLTTSKLLATKQVFSAIAGLQRTQTKFSPTWKKRAAQNAYASNLPLCIQPKFLKISMTTTSIIRHASFINFLPSSFERATQLLAQYAPLNTTCKRDIESFLLNTKSFRHSQIAQHRAATPMSICFLCFRGQKLSQLPSKCVIFCGGGIPKAIWTTPQTILAKIQLKKRCSIVSLLLQKQQHLLPFHLLFSKLSFVNVTPLLKYHKKILILLGIFNLQIIET